MTNGTLKVKIIEARNLKDEDVVGQSDVYIEAWLDKDYKQATSTKSGTTNPTWNETLTFNVTGGGNKLHIKVLDKDTLSDDKIGGAEIKLDQVYAGHGFDEWVKLPKLLGLMSNGEVHVNIQFQKS
jgi:Ca2+-dependent lipid-binding protein